MVLPLYCTRIDFAFKIQKKGENFFQKISHEGTTAQRTQRAMISLKAAISIRAIESHKKENLNFNLTKFADIAGTTLS